MLPYVARLRHSVRGLGVRVSATRYESAERKTSCCFVIGFDCCLAKSIAALHNWGLFWETPKLQGPARPLTGRVGLGLRGPLTGRVGFGLRGPLLGAWASRSARPLAGRVSFDSRVRPCLRRSVLLRRWPEHHE